MEFSADIILDWMGNYFWPYSRISAMLMVMTVTGARFVSTRIRLYLGLAITFAVMPAIPAVPEELELMSFQGFLTTFEQLVIGVAMGMVTQFMLQTFVVLGQILGMQASLGFASMVDPANGQNTPLLGQLFMFLATMFFLSTDGHLQMIQLVVMSFTTLPIGEGALNTVDYRELALWFGAMFKMALSMSLSGIIALLTINLSFGVMTRAAPQLNIFSLGFAFALLVGLLICWYIIAGIYTHYDLYWIEGRDQICRLVRINC
ncbi:putative Flagellar biosynthesis protein FliR [Vibrio nigripulchritudo MADA3029]|uniref:flagellar biosynthetic protein FliR n=1 Tax=Vibrio TaxID=662 RepID=UPI00021C1566|nr:MULTISPECIES: flagellar biosynthetic protein FliR [Vibrio]EGU54306.1 flagellar biosynthesis protein FliR [Vibrio nigripulchritudo ATCC 27043]UAB71262.1 flagellar type III secretion system protein FliR [Vibrio sp. SCSIO 43132]CCN48746.1 putative Flagellar biosynthesis protein FliR [Vibrio nigripulchritudo MADA3020]CCN52809.1 putative Flagellar biosynthesis protein FliR [Vibrio nigripulchritudo MADA3021]CCN57700.1 putative Flagellar biosynthesis protein FliR [Vibrio nigripulchritudo MADA3029]